MLVKSDTTIRLWRGEKTRRLRLKVQTGDASVVSAQRAIEIETELGIAVLQPGSQLRVRPGRHGQRYEVTFGRAILSHADGQQVTLSAGEGIGVDTAAESGSSVAAPPAAAPVPDAGTIRAVEPPIKALPAGPGDLTIGLGASATIYDPQPPTAVGIDAHTLCPAGALLAVHGRAPTRMAAGETLLASRGLTRLQTHCLNAAGQPSAVQSHGTVRVLPQSGHRTVATQRTQKQHRDRRSQLHDHVSEPAAGARGALAARARCACLHSDCSARHGSRATGPSRQSPTCVRGWSATRGQP